MNKVLMGRGNHNGWKLEELAKQLQGEVYEKSMSISSSDHDLAPMILKNNKKIFNLLKEIERIQRETYRQLDARQPNRGPANPRL